MVGTANISSQQLMWDPNGHFTALVPRNYLNGSCALFRAYTAAPGSFSEILGKNYYGTNSWVAGVYIGYHIGRYLTTSNVPKGGTGSRVWANEDLHGGQFDQQITFGNGPVLISDQSVRHVAFPSIPSAGSPDFLWSDDGINWTTESISGRGAGGAYNVDGYINGGNHTNGYYFTARAIDSPSTTMYVYYSSDGINWSRSSAITKQVSTESPVGRPVWHFAGYYWLQTTNNLYRSTTPAGPWSWYDPGFTFINCRDAYVWAARGMYVFPSSSGSPTTTNLEYSFDMVTWNRLTNVNSKIIWQFSGSADGTKWVAGPAGVYSPGLGDYVKHGT